MLLLPQLELELEEEGRSVVEEEEEEEALERGTLTLKEVTQQVAGMVLQLL